jgi:hypothetical protein
VIAGLVASITALCFYKERITVNAICNKIGIKMSTIQSQVKKNIFNRLKIPGFVSLVRSSKLLKETLINMGVFNPEQEIMVEGESTDIIEVQLGNGTKIFNSNNNIDYYMFITKDDNKLPLSISVKFFHTLESFENKYFRNKTNNNNNNNKVKKELLLEFEVLRFYPSKDPPS